MKAPALQKALPDFAFTATSGLSGKLSDYRGQKVILYFYPKDNTPGCTNESIDFSQYHAQFAHANTVVFGISRDSLKSHENFKAKYNMPFELICDKEEILCQLFDVIKEKSLYGKKYLGIDRSTFLIDANGVLRQEWRGVKVPGHVEAVLTAVNQL